MLDTHGGATVQDKSIMNFKAMYMERCESPYPEESDMKSARQRL